MMQELGTAPQSLMCELLHNDDERLFRAFGLVLQRMRESPRSPEVHEAWQSLESQLMARLRAEAEVVLPRLELTSYGDAVTLRYQHLELARRLEQLALDLELHQFNAAQAASFLELLASYVAREQQVVRPWAERALSPRAKDQLLWSIRQNPRAVS